MSAQHSIPFRAKIIVDLFAGGGGASTGIEQALGRAVDLAINHGAVAECSGHQGNAAAVAVRMARVHRYPGVPAPLHG